jgi:hypothetical protein
MSLSSKKCSTCELEKSLDAFRSGRARCRDCEREYSRNKYKTLQDKRASGEGTDFCKRCERTLPVGDFSTGGNATICKICRSCAIYGITYKDFIELGNTQDWKCPGCSTDLTDKRQGSPNSAHIDHDHITGRVRGLLCMHCNHVLGKVKDDMMTLKNLMNYLEVPFD